jgi:hypothetical protein
VQGFTVGEEWRSKNGGGAGARIIDDRVTIRTITTRGSRAPRQRPTFLATKCILASWNEKLLDFDLCSLQKSAKSREFLFISWWCFETYEVFSSTHG